MAEYLTKVKLSAAGSVDVGIPTNGGILGVYSDVAVKLEWVYNGQVGTITPTAATVWEPHNVFAPGPFSALRITSTAAAEISIRMV